MIGSWRHIYTFNLGTSLIAFSPPIALKIGGRELCRPARIVIGAMIVLAPLDTEGKNILTFHQCAYDR